MELLEGAGVIMVQFGLSRHISISACLLEILIIILSGCQFTPKTASDHAWKARSYVGQGNRNAALEHYTQAITLEPDTEKRCGYIVNRAVLRHNEYQHLNDSNAEQDISGAERDLNEAVRLCPDHTHARMVRGHFYANTGHPEKGLEDYNFLVSNDPANAFFWSMRATSYALLGDSEHAISDADKAITLSRGKPIEALYYQRSAWVRNKCGDIEGSIQDIDKSVSLKKGLEKCPYLLMKGAILEEHGQKMEAIAAYEQCIKVCGGIPIDKMAEATAERVHTQAAINMISNIGKETLMNPNMILGAGIGSAVGALINEAGLAKVYRDDAKRQIKRIKADKPPL